MRLVQALLMSAVLLATPWPVPFWGVLPAQAQDVGVVQSQVLVLDPERLFETTQLGRSLAAGLQAEREALIARNRAWEAELEAEEHALTAQRATTSPEEFRDLADAFDAKVQEIRRDSERRVRDLERNRERAPVDFMRQVEPVLVEIMREAGASVVMDQRSVLLRNGLVDITAVAAARIDARFPAAPPVAPPAEEPAPETVPDDAN